jgi:hypothetical protein
MTDPDPEPPAAPDTVDLDGRTFVGVSNAADGDVGSDTVFVYRQEDDLVWAEYSGGSVRKGFLVGTRTGDGLSFRYSHLDGAGETAGGACRSRIEVLGDGRVRLHETWAWESRAGTGRSVVEEPGRRP